MSAYSFLKEYTVDQLNKFIEEKKPICDKQRDEAYGASNVGDFQRLYEQASEPLVVAQQYLNLKLNKDDIDLKPHDDYGDLMLLENFIEYCKDGLFIDYDGFGCYATKTQQSDISLHPSDVLEGKYRKDFTHVKWYNK